MPVIVSHRIPLTSIAVTTPDLMREVGEMAIRLIQARTRQGRDADGQAFAPYSPKYAKRKAKETGTSGTVNLTLSGDVLNDLQVIEATKTSVLIGWVR